MIFKSFIVAATMAGSIVAASAADISGAGATFPFPIYAKWADTYKKETGNGLNYQSIGSGGGIKQIKAKTVTFGASDMPLTPKDLKDAGLVQFPTVVGGLPLQRHCVCPKWPNGCRQWIFQFHRQTEFGRAWPVAHISHLGSDNSPRLHG